MNKIKLIALISFFAITINLNAQKHTKTIDKKFFLENVVNYKKDSKIWTYLGDKPAIIDFYASWCKPCRMIEPILEDLAKEYKGKINIYKVNVDKEKELANDLGIRSLPTIVFAPKGKNPSVLVGAKSKEELKKYIEEILLKE